MRTQELAGEVLQAADYRLRAHRLRHHRERFTLEQVDAFLDRARDAFRSDPEQARQCARLARYVARKLDDHLAHARSLRALTQACMLLGRYPEALRAVDGALLLLRLRGERQERAELQSMRVEVLTQLERWPEAREVGRRALATLEELGHTRGIIRIRMALADLATKLDQPRESLRHYRHVEWLLPEGASARVRAVIATNRGSALLACNRFRAATRWFEQARALFVEEGCEHSTAHLDYSLAHAAFKQGRFDEALERFDAVAPILERLEDEMHRAHVDLDRAEIHLLLRLPDDARAYAERAGERFHSLGLTRDRAQAEVFAGRASAQVGEYRAAARLFERARAGFAALEMTGREVSCVVHESRAWLKLERPARAMALASEAEGLLTPFSNPLTSAAVRLLQARLAQAAGQHDAAREAVDVVLASTRRIYAPWLHVEAHALRAEACHALGRDDEAIAALRSAVALVERGRSGVPADEYRAAYFSAGSELYQSLVDLLLDRGELEAAFECAQRAKARGLLDTRAAARGDKPRASLRDSRIDALRASLHAVYSELLRDGLREGGSPEERFARHRQAQQLEDELEALLRRRRGGARGAGSGTAPLPTLSEIRTALGGNATLIEYLHTPRGLVIFAVTADAIHALRPEVAPAEIDECVQRLRFHLAKHELPELAARAMIMEATRENLARLAELILMPVAEHCEGKRLVVGAHDRVHGIPFHALPWGEGWLCEAFDVLHVPSGAVFARCASRTVKVRAAGAVLGVPSDEVPHVEVEARAVAGLMGTDRLMLGRGASLSALRREAAEARVLHIVTHGMFRRAHPRLSALKLGDGWVSHDDLVGMRLGGELVVLSTCESGVAAVGPGHEILGLARAFFRAGARALLCSQWRVRDEIAAAFMHAFYSALRDGADATAAHGAAMAAVRAENPHPYYWAPFFLMGAPGASASATDATHTGTNS